MLTKSTRKVGDKKSIQNRLDLGKTRKPRNPAQLLHKLGFSLVSAALNRIYKLTKPLKSKGPQDYVFYIRIYLFAFSLTALPHPS